MSDDGVPNDEMPTFPVPRTTRPTRADELADRLLAGDQPAADAPARYAALAELFSAAAQPGSLAELSGEAQARSLFRAAGLAGSSSATSPHSRRKTMLSHLLTAKLAAAIAAGTLTLGGTAAAAYASALPAGLQDFAHDTIGAPAATTGTDSTASTSPNSPTNSTSEAGADDASSPSATPTPDGTPAASAHPVGPNAAGPAAYGLCTAFTAHQAHGSTPSASVAFRNLAAAAGGAQNIAAYCATIPHPGSASSHQTPTPTTQPSEATTPASKHDKPTVLPSQASTHASEHRTGKPTALPSQASTHASDHGSGAAAVSRDAQP